MHYRHSDRSISAVEEFHATKSGDPSTTLGMTGVMLGMTGGLAGMMEGGMKRAHEVIPVIHMTKVQNASVMLKRLLGWNNE